jgi:hypothetical protein
LADLRIDADSMHHQLPGRIEPRTFTGFLLVGFTCPLSTPES